MSPPLSAKETDASEKWGISKYYSESNYRLLQANLKLVAVVGTGYHVAMYLLGRNSLDQWDSLAGRLIAILMLLAAPYLFSKEPLSLGQKWGFEVLWMLELPIWFSLHMFMNGASAFEASSLLFAGGIYGLFVNPPKGLLFFPLSVLGVFTILTFSQALPQPQLVSGIWLTIPAYMASFSMGLVQMAIRKVVREVENKNHLIQIQKEKLERANEAKRQFLANMSHEIRTPMNAILGFSQIMSNHLDQNMDPARNKVFLEHIMSSGENLLMLINNILDISKIEAGKMVVNNEDFDLHRVLKNVYNTHSGEARRKGLKYDLVLDPDLPRIIHTDQVKFFQIVMNLTSNAIKFTSTGSVSIMAHQVNDRILVVINDEGIGISAQHLDTIFDVFEQGDSSTTKTYGGTGLGLAISKQLAEMLGGSVGVESKVGKGSTFFLEIPYIEGLEQKTQASSQSVNSDYRHLNPIMVVEDNDMNRLMMVALFEDLKLPIETAENGQVALDRIFKLQAAKKLPQLIFMDIHMPVMDGIEAVKRLRAVPELRRLNIVALSADAFLEQQQRALDAGFSDYLTKPFDIEKLVTIISRYVPQVKVADILKDEPPEDELFNQTSISNLEVKIQKELIEMFYSQVSNALEKLDGHIARLERDDVREMAHFIKGSALNLQAEPLAAISKELQDKAAKAEKETLQAFGVKLRECFEETWNAIAIYASRL